MRAEEDSAHLPALRSDDTGRPDETVVGVRVDSISDDGMGIENGGSSSSSSSFTPRLSVATDMACSGVGVGAGVGDDVVPLAVLPPPSIEEQVSLVRVVLENSKERKPGQTRYLVTKRYFCISVWFVDWLHRTRT